MPSSDIVEIILKLQNVRQFVEGALKASGAVKGVGDAADKSGKKTRGSWKSLAKWAGAAGAMIGATRYIHGAVDATTDLARGTLALQRSTNLDTKTASEWVNVLKERGISTKTFQVGLKTLSKQMEKSRTDTNTQLVGMRRLRREYAAVSAAGGKDAPKALDKLSKEMTRLQARGEKSRKVLADLGVSFSAVRRGDVKAVLLQTADALKDMTNPAQRVATVQALLGRSGVALLPVLMKGREGIEELLGVQERYGNYIDGKGKKNALKLIEQQRELHAAMEGLRVQLGQSLMPVLVQVGGIFVQMARIMAPLTKNATLFKIAIALLTVVFIAYKVAMILATISQWSFNAALLVTVGWVALIVVALVALAAGVIYAYKHWRWFRVAVDAAWKAIKVAATVIVGALKTAINWIKSNWKMLVPILFGPFGIAVALIIKHIDKIKSAIQWVIDKVTALIDKLTSIPNIIKHLPGGKLLSKGLHAVGLQHGGTVLRGGAALVGERGPEVLSLPTGARVAPLQTSAGAVAGAAGMEIIVPLYLDGKVLAHAVARVTADKLARR